LLLTAKVNKCSHGYYVIILQSDKKAACFSKMLLFVIWGPWITSRWC